MAKNYLERLNKAITYSQEGKKKRAYSKLKKLNDEFPGVETIIYNLAVSSEKLNKKEQALELYRKALELNPSNPDNLFGLGSFLMHNGDLAEAEALLSQATKIDEANAMYWNNLGVANFLIKNYFKATECFEKATKIEPHNPDFWYNLKDAYGETGNLELFEKASTKYKRLIQGQ